MFSFVGRILDMINYEKDDFDGNLDEIMESINNILKKTGKGYETIDESEKKEKKKD